MTNFAFDWTTLSTPALYGELAQAVGISNSESIDVSRGCEIITRIFRAVGGPPFAARSWSDTEQGIVARQLLREAIRHTLRRFGIATVAKPGYMRNNGGHPWLEALLDPVERLPINIATTSQLEALPDIGPVLARAIVSDREVNGAFLNRADLARRVIGLSDSSINAISSRLIIEPISLTTLHLNKGNELVEDLRQLFSLVGGSSQPARLQTALALVAVECATNPHPCARHGEIRTFAIDDQLGTEASADVGLLLNVEYYERLPGLLAGANFKIDICLFHAALTEPGHPTHVLLDALVAARARGIDVRVLLDQDRLTDPYGSTITNTPARNFLLTNGIPCRFDNAERLLHSKYLLIDNNLAVIGSHNWSVGSFFVFDDLSVVIESERLVTELRHRFEELWSRGS